MGKRMQRHSVHEKHQSGCISGLISIFDFRQGSSTRKLLWDRRHGNSSHAVGIGYSRSRFKLLTDIDRKPEGNNDGDESKTSKINTGKTSVKKLMEEEMSSEQQPKRRTPSAAAEKIKSDQEHRRLGKKQNCACKVECDPKASTSLDSQESYLNLAALMEEFCSQIHQRQEMYLQHENEVESFDGQNSVSSVSLDQLDELDMQLVHKHSILEEKLGEAAEAFLNQKFINAKQLTRDGEIRQSKQFTDALEILNSNRDLILKLLDDSNSLLVKHIQDLREAQSEKLELKKSLTSAKLSDEIVDSKECQELVHHKQFQKQNLHNFLWRMVKSQSKSPQQDSPPASNRIVVLKPNPAGIQNSAATTSPRSSTQFHYSLTNPRQGGRLNSRFSLREIKRKLKQIMGESRKEHHRISMDGILHKIPCECQSSGHGGKVVSVEIDGEALPSKTNFEKASKPSTSGRSEDNTGNGTNHQPRTGNNEDTAITIDGSKSLTVEATEFPKPREPNIYIEAKKHLSDMVSAGDEHLDLSINEVPETLGTILSLPEYISSPIFSPGRDIDHTFVTAQMRFSFSDNFGIVSENVWKPKQDYIDPLSPFMQDLETELHTSDEIKLQVLDLNPDISEELLPENILQHSMLSSHGELCPKGGMEILEITDSVFLKESDFLVPSETNSSTLTSRSNTRIDLTEMWGERGSSKCLSMDSPIREVKSSSSLASLSSNPSFVQEIEAAESINDRPERPSPVSVLQPFFFEDVASPETTKSQPAELQIQPRQIHFAETDSSAVVVALSDREIYLTTCVEDKKPTFEYVRAVLEASGLSWDEFSTTYQSSDQPLDPSLFDEVEIFSTQLYSDPMLLFDCINEVLLELYDHYFGCPPWVSFVKSNIRPVPVGNSIIREVWEGIDWHLIPPPLPCTLDDIIGKDMAKTGTWMNLQYDTEVVGIQIEEAILKELIEDTISNLCT